MAEEELIGQVTHYYDKAGVAIVKFERGISAGSKLRFKGAHTDFVHTADSIQFEHQSITTVKAGQEVGIKVDQRVHEGDKVYQA